MKKTKLTFKYSADDIANLDGAFAHWLYSCVDSYRKQKKSAHIEKFEVYLVKGKYRTQNWMLKRICKLLEPVVNDEGVELDEFNKRVKKAAKLWAKVLPSMWL